ncbi:flavin reductase family protein [Moorella naiadis]|uniref:flavin reductase family protein n=1 Tax=Moorella naiadis (nom. illeg.) TaxID=3093670 RepID=UPI003D9CB382
MEANPLNLINYGLYIVTARQDNRFNGLVTNIVFQVAAEPPTVLTGINTANLTHEYITGCQAFNVSILAEDTPLALIERFGYKSGRQIDKFAGLRYELGRNGIPYLIDHTLAFLETRVTGSFTAGKQTIFIGQITNMGVLREGRPLSTSYHQHAHRWPVPKNASLYNPETLYFG